MPLRAKNTALTPDALQTSWSVSVAGAQVDDIAVLQQVYRGGSGVTPGTPSGWTLIRNDTQGTTAGQAWFWKLITSAGTVTVTATISSANNMALGLTIWSGRDTASPVNAHGGQGNASATSATAPTVTTTADGCDLLVGFALTASVNQDTAPTGMTEEYDAETIGGGGNATVVLSSQAQATQGATGTRTGTLNGSSVSVGATIALAPSVSTPAYNGLGGGPTFRGVFGHEPPDNLANGDLGKRVSILFPSRNSGTGFVADARAANPTIAAAIYISVTEVKADGSTPQSTIMLSSADFASLQEQDYLHSVPNGGLADRIKDTSFNTYFIDPASPRWLTIWKANWQTIRNARTWANGLYFDNLEFQPNNWLKASATGRGYGIGNVEYTSANYGPALASFVSELVTFFRGLYPNDLFGGNLISFPSSADLSGRWGFLDFWAPEATVGYGTTYPTVADLRNRIQEMQQFVALGSKKIIVSHGYTKLVPPERSLTEEATKIDFFLAFHAMVMRQQATITAGSMTWPGAAVRWYNHGYDPIWIESLEKHNRNLGQPTATAVEGPSGVFTRQFQYGTVVCDLNVKTGTFTLTGTPPPTGETGTTIGGPASNTRLMTDDYARASTFQLTTARTITAVEIAISTDGTVAGGTQPLRLAFFSHNGTSGKPDAILGESERKTFNGGTLLNSSPTRFTFSTPLALAANTPYWFLALSGPVTGATSSGFLRLAQNPDAGESWYDGDTESNGFASPFDPNTNANGPLTSSLVFTLIESTATPTAPTAPTGLTATALSANVVRYDWTDASSNETGFVIHRSRSTNFTTFEIIEVGAGVTTYTDNQVASGTTYYVRIKAVNTTTGLESDYAAVATVTTPLRPGLPATPKIGQGEYLVIVRAPDGTKLAELDRSIYTGLAYSKARTKAGWLTVDLRGDDPRIAQFVDKCQIEVRRRDVTADVPWYTDFSGVFRGFEIWTDDKGVHHWRARCLGDLHRLSWRRIAHFAGVAERTQFTNRSVEFIMKTLVERSAGPLATAGSSATDRRRAGVITGLSIEPNLDRGQVRSWAASWSNLLAELQELAKVAGGDFDLVKVGPASWEFRFYDGQRGQDLTETVVFSLANANMTQPHYTEDYASEATVAIVGGRGDKDQREIVIRTNAARYSADNDIETFVDARSTEPGDTAALEAAGDAALYAARVQRKLSFTAQQSPSTIYGKHYAVGGALGDRVLGQYFGSEVAYQINGVTVGFATSGKEEIKLDLVEMP